MCSSLAILAVLLCSRSGDNRLPPLGARVQSAGSLVAALAETGGVSVVLSPGLSNHSVFFYERGVPLDVALNGVAWCLHATLTQTPSGYVISRSASDVRDAEAARQRLGASWIKARVEAVRKFRQERIAHGGLDSAFQSELSAAESRQMSIVTKGVDRNTGFAPTELLPTEELLLQLIERIGYSRLASVPTGTVAVFEDDPIPGAESLPAHDDILDAYATAVAGKPHPTVADEMTVDGRVVRTSIPHRIAPPEAVDYPDGGVLKEDRLRLKCTMGTGRLMLSLEGFDRNGKRNLQAWFAAGPVPTLYDLGQLTRLAERDLKAKFAPLGADTLAVLANLQNPARVVDKRPFKPPTWVTDPESNDPLGFWVRDALAALCSDAPQNCVAIDVPDLLWGATKYCVSPRGLCLDTLHEAMKEYLPMDVLAKGDVLAERPVDMGACEANASRPGLQHLANKNAPVRDGSLRSYATLVTSATKGSATLPLTWADQCDGLQVIGSNVHAVGWGYLKLIAGISESDWQNLLGGSVLSAKQLGIEDQLSSLLRSEQGVDLVESSRQPDIFKSHPMEILGDRGVGDCGIAVQSINQPMLRQASDPSWAWGGFDQFASRFIYPGLVVSFKGDQPVLPVSRADFESKYEATSIRTCTAVGIILRIDLAPGAAIEKRVIERFDVDSDTITYADLPIAMRDKIWNQAVDLAVTRARAARAGIGQPAPVSSVKSVSPPPL